MSEDEFGSIVDSACALRPTQAKTLQAVYERRWDVEVERASEAAYAAAERAARIWAKSSDDPIWRALDRLCGISGGAADAALAVLVRDLIPPTDFAVLTQPWREVGLDIPGSPQARGETRPDCFDCRAARTHTHR